MSEVNEQERRLLAGVLAHPETWPQVERCLGTPDPGDPWLVTAWHAVRSVHERGERLDVPAALDRFEVIRSRERTEVNSDDRRAFVALSNVGPGFITSRAVMDAADRAVRARESKAVASMLRRAANQVGDSHVDAHELLDDLRDTLRRTYRRPLTIPIANAAEGTKRALESTAPAVIPTGFACIDDEIGGLPIGQLTLAGARTGRGKTTFLGALARNQIFANAARPITGSTGRLELAASRGPYMLLVSCENSAAMIWERLACDMLDVESDDMRSYRARAIDCEPLGPRSQPYIDALAQHGRFTVIDEETMGDISISTVRASIEAWADAVRAEDPDATLLVMVDYLQRIDPTEKQASEARHRQIDLAAKSLSTLAKTRGIAIVATEQINDAPDNAEPGRGDSRESKGANNEAGLILILHTWSAPQRAALVAKYGEGSPQLRCMSLLCGKARGARDGWRTVLDFDGAHYRITDAADRTNYLLEPATLRVGSPKPRRPRNASLPELPGRSR